MLSNALSGLDCGILHATYLTHLGCVMGVTCAMCTVKVYHIGACMCSSAQSWCLQSMAETIRVVRQAMKCDTRQLLKFDSDDFIDDAIYMEQQKLQAAGRTSWPQ